MDIYVRIMQKLTVSFHFFFALICIYNVQWSFFCEKEDNSPNRSTFRNT